MTASEILGVPVHASSEEIRAAYLEKVKQFPPDRAPEEFEKIRDAYDLLRDPRRRAQAVLNCPEASKSFRSLADGLEARRIFAGPQAWREVLKHK
jgi:DnaJ-class molecular chaperone